MALPKTTKFQTADFLIFLCTYYCDFLINVYIAREVFSGGKEQQILPVLQCLRVGIAFSDF